MNMKLRRTIAAVGLFAGLVWARGASANLILNGGFETGNFTDWQQSGDHTFTTVSAGIQHSGMFAAMLGTLSGTGFLTQGNLPTVPGHTYTLTYWLKNPIGDAPTSFEALWNGIPIPGSELLDPAAFGYTQFTFNVVASGTSSSVGFEYQQAPAEFFLDDVNITPEPSTMLLLGSGLLGFYAARRRRR